MRAPFWNCAAISVAFVLLGAGVVSAGQGGPNGGRIPLALQKGEAGGLRASARGRLGAGDRKDPVRGTACKEYAVTLERGTTYVIDLEARGKDFDPYLRLKDEQGRQLASDDDSGEGWNARIIFPCLRTGTYVIVATTYAGDLGPFELTVRTPLAPGATKRATPGRLQREPEEAGVIELPSRSYPFQFEKDRTYVIELAAAEGEKVEPVIRLKDAKSWLQEGTYQTPQAGHAVLTFPCTVTGPYVVVATTSREECMGAFVLTVRERAPRRR